ncbi:MAG: DUF2868 domain-containing protein [Verrucomicrobiales bacterium]
MKPENVYQILLVRAVEEDDPRGDRLPFPSREDAARRAGEGYEPSDPGPETALRGKDWNFLALRAAYLASPAAGIAKVSPNPPSLRGAAIFGLVAAVLLGAASHTAGLAHHFHLFAGPFLFVLIWNLLVVGFLIFRLFLPKHAGAKPSWMLRSLEWWQELRAGSRDTPATSRAFLARWLETTSPAFTAKFAAFLHAASIAFALGLVACVYIRGLSSQYAAGWESTWLEAKHVRQVLGTVLYPASSLTGIPLPSDNQEWEALRFSRAGTGVPAGNWIHLHAVTLGLFAILPRMAFGLLAWFKGIRLGRKPPPWKPGDGYARRLLRGSILGGTLVGVVPYGFKSTAILTNGRYKDAIARLLAEVWGRDAITRWEEPILYGGEIPNPDSGATTSGILILFDIRATPESEVHGQALASARELYQGHSMLAAIETAEFPEERLDTRLAAWTEMTRQLGIQLVVLDEGMPVDSCRPPSDSLIQL